MDKLPDELKVISEFMETLGHPGEGFSEIGDDVGHFSLDGRKIVAKCDMLVRKTDVPPEMKTWQISRKALVSVISDFSAKGVKPLAFMFSLGLPRKITMGEVRELAEGFRKASKEFQVPFIGGDTNECDDLVIDCILLGLAKEVVGRRGAKPGDIVAVTGPFGYTSAGLSILTKGFEGTKDFVRRAKASVLMPKSKLQLGIALAERGLMTSSVDSSDGLAISLHELAGAGGVRIVLDELPAPPGLKDFCVENGLRFEDLVLKGGEEYEVVFSSPKERMDKVEELANRHGVKIMRIGRVLKGPSMVEFKGEVMEREGWVHLR